MIFSDCFESFGFGHFREREVLGKNSESFKSCLFLENTFPRDLPRSSTVQNMDCQIKFILYVLLLGKFTKESSDYALWK